MIDNEILLKKQKYNTKQHKLKQIYFHNFFNNYFFLDK